MTHWGLWWSYLSLPAWVIVSCKLLSLLSHRLIWMLYHTLVFLFWKIFLNTTYYFPWISLFLENGLPFIPTHMKFSSSVKAFKVCGIGVCFWLLVNKGQRKWWLMSESWVKICFIHKLCTSSEIKSKVKGRSCEPFFLEPVNQ